MVLRRTAETMPAGNRQAQRDQQRRRPRARRWRACRSTTRCRPARRAASTAPKSPRTRALEEAAVLHDERIVEAHRLAELRDVLGGGVGRQQHAARDRRSRCRMRNTTKETPSSTSSDCSSRRAGTIFMSAARERAHGLDVRRVGEHVDRLHPLQPIAVAHELADVAGERGRGCTTRRRCGAGAERRQRAERLGVKARARRIGHHDLGAHARRASAAGSTWRTSPARNVQLAMPLAARVAAPRRPPRPGPARCRTRARTRRASSRLMAPVPE